MAEIRKHNPRIRGKLDEALAKALGENVRPVAPGGRPDPSTEEAKPTPSEPERPPVAAVPSVGTGWTTFTGKPTVLAKKPADDDDLDEWDDEDD